MDNERLAMEDLMTTIRNMDDTIQVYGFCLAAEVIAFAKEHNIDVAFLDIEMPDINGLQIAKYLKEINPHTNLIFVTAYARYALEAFSLYASGYLLKPVSAKMIQEALHHLRYPLEAQNKQRVKVQTFGNFEVFVDGHPLHFSRSKSKEILAYLVHKKGTGCTLRELFAVLFEDKQYTISIQNQMQTYISSMMKTLKEAGIEDIIVKKFNHFSVDITKIDCDFYKFMDWDVDAINSYTGEYMANYSWGEFTVGYLEQKLKMMTKVK